MVMKDRWINGSYDLRPMCPYVEPPPDYGDLVRIDIMVNMGYDREEIEKSLKQGNFDDIMATYLLLDPRRSSIDSTSQDPSNQSRKYEICLSIYLFIYLYFSFEICVKNWNFYFVLNFVQ